MLAGGFDPPTVVGGVSGLFDATAVVPGVVVVVGEAFDDDVVVVDVLLGDAAAVAGAVLVPLEVVPLRSMTPEFAEAGLGVEAVDAGAVEVDATDAVPEELETLSAPQAASPSMRLLRTALRICERAMKAKLVIDHYPG